MDKSCWVLVREHGDQLRWVSGDGTPIFPTQQDYLLQGLYAEVLEVVYIPHPLGLFSSTLLAKSTVWANRLRAECEQEVNHG